MIRSVRPALIALSLLAASAMPRLVLAQQSSSTDEWMARCNRDDGYRDDDDVRYCEVRDTTIAASKLLDIDARENGSVSIHAWDQNSIRVVAKIQANTRNGGDPRSIAKGVTVAMSDGRIRADGPRTSGRSWWAVSYEIWVPRKTDLDVRAENGGIAVADVDGTMRLETVNGGVALNHLAGDVRAETTNGGITAELTGNQWSGAGFSAETTNGGVRVTMPDDYSAELETGTVNGSLNIDFPVTIRGRFSKQLTTTLGKGGPRVRVETTNGGVTIRRA